MPRLKLVLSVFLKAATVFSLLLLMVDVLISPPPLREGLMGISSLLLGKLNRFVQVPCLLEYRDRPLSFQLTRNQQRLRDILMIYYTVDSVPMKTRRVSLSRNLRLV